MKSCCIVSDPGQPDYGAFHYTYKADWRWPQFLQLNKHYHLWNFQYSNNYRLQFYTILNSNQVWPSVNFASCSAFIIKIHLHTFLFIHHYLDFPSKITFSLHWCDLLLLTPSLPCFFNWIYVAVTSALKILARLHNTHLYPFKVIWIMKETSG